ncbi:Gti1/Pac2 family-domain-containing protein [Lanmaoa asiatica]|nr:Gti1/Pac2 family-domain-containing protein [Lanmaoa asiatica]
MQQRPTCINVRIRSTRDAHKIFYGVQRRVLPMITRRLDADERLALRSGCVYAWEERGPHTEITGLGIERFTEGRRWSPSRVRDEFLFYYEKYTPPADAGHSSTSDKQPPRDWDPLVKQTYSVWVETEKGRRKWHLTAYFTQATVDQLGTIDDIPVVAELVVPEGTFQSTRVSKNRKGDDARARTDVFKVPSSVTRTYATFPAAYPAQPTPYPGPSPPTFTQEPYRVSPQASHPPTFYHPPEVPQFSVPPPLPPLGTLHTLPPLRPEAEDVEYKFRRPSLPGISDYQSNALSRDRKVNFDQGCSAEYSSSPNPSSLSRHVAALPSNSPVEERGAQYRPELACTYPSFVRESTSNFDRPSSTVGIFQPTPDAAGQDENTFAYNSHTTATTQSSHSNCSQISLPPPAQLFRSEPPAQLSAVRTSEDSASAIGSSRVDLAPLHSLQRRPYRRNPVDDMALRSLGPRSG